MITDFQLLAFKIHSIGFFYLPKLPVSHDRQFENLVVSRSPIKWLVTSFLFLCTSSQGVLCAGLVFYFGIFRSHDEFNWVRLIMLTLISLVFLLTSLIATSLFSILPQIISSYNAVLKMNRDLTGLGKQL